MSNTIIFLFYFRIIPNFYKILNNFLKCKKKQTYTNLLKFIHMTIFYQVGSYCLLHQGNGT